MPYFSSRYELRSSYVLRVGGLLSLTTLLSLWSCGLLAKAQTSSPGVAIVQEGGLFDRVVGKQKQSELELDGYERMQRIELRKTGSDPGPYATKVLRLFPAGPAINKIALSPDGRPISTESYRSELDKLEKYLLWAMQDGAAQKDAYAKAERKRRERFDLIEATHQAFVFTFAGKEMRSGRTLLRYIMEPNPKYKPTSRNTTLFTKVHGTIWIDEQSSQLAKIEGTVTEDISLSFFLAKVYKGSHFMQERYEVAPGIWEPTFEQYDFDGRKFLVPFSIHERAFYSDYKFVGPPTVAINVVRAELNKLSGQPPAH